MPMKKTIILLCLGISLANGAWAQTYLLIIQGEEGKFFVEHTVAAKENWYSVGREYNVSPKEMAPFNGLTLNHPLSVGEHIKIPLSATNFTQTTKKGSGEALVPVYHTIQEKEWMYHISTTYNKVPIADLEKWNHIKSDQAKAGMQLIIGYLRVNASQSSLANATAAQPEQLTSEAPGTSKPLADSKPLVAEVSPHKSTSVQPSETKAVESGSLSSSAVASNSASVNKYSGIRPSGGFFAADFADRGKTASGLAATFKSTSGWQDGKYYALMNNVPVGTIVRISSSVTGKNVYAKVLGQLPDMKESAGLTIRMSNSAAAELGAGDGKFAVELRY
jgi:LysM repeat protein